MIPDTRPSPKKKDPIITYWIEQLKKQKNKKTNSNKETPKTEN